MKLRLKGNSIRLRLAKAEVARFAEAGVVEERVEFGQAGPPLVYAVEAVPREDVSTDFEGGRIRVLIPEDAASKWARSEEVGIYGSANGLKISVEKDFACLKPREGEDESDMYPHPNPDAC